MKTRFFLLLLGQVFLYQFSFCQKKPDTINTGNTGNSKVISKNDSLAASNVLLNDTNKIKHSPRKATIRSAVIPGWGQAYNKKYWKIPLVYAALGTTAYAFTFNIKQYKRISYAYNVLITQ